MIHISVARDEDDVGLLPAECGDFLAGSRQEVRVIGPNGAVGRGSHEGEVLARRAAKPATRAVAARSRTGSLAFSLPETERAQLANLRGERSKLASRFTRSASQSPPPGAPLISRSRQLLQLRVHRKGPYRAVWGRRNHRRLGPWGNEAMSANLRHTHAKHPSGRSVLNARGRESAHSPARTGTQ
jgi:hypothetical protein